MGRSTKRQAAENRARVVDAAARLFREHGLNGIGIADVMAEAGLTHGGFYRQFPSKDAFAAEACARAMAAGLRTWQDIAERAPPGQQLSAVTDAYLNRAASDHKCPMPALAGDIARTPADSPVREAFSQGLRNFATVLAGCIDDPNRDQLALSRLAAMVGAVAIAKASNDETFAAAIMQAVRSSAGLPPPANP
jgi:TetR/AcrR family transcriptional repressor of nem operon